MQVDLTADDVTILRELVDARIEELGPEIHHARTPEYHDSLKRTREMLRRLSERLEPAAA